MTSAAPSGLHVNVTNQQGFSPLHVAALHGHVALVELFLQRGGNVDTRTVTHACTPLHLACQNNRQYTHKVVRRFSFLYIYHPQTKCVCLWVGEGVVSRRDTHTPLDTHPQASPPGHTHPWTHHETHTPPSQDSHPHGQQAGRTHHTGMLSCLIIFWNTSVLIVGPLIPLFGTSGDICTGVKARVGTLTSMLCCLHAIDSVDSPLVWHLLTSCQPAWKASHFYSTCLHTYIHWLSYCLGSRVLLPHSVWQDRRFTRWAIPAQLDFIKILTVRVLSQVVKHLVEHGCKINCQDSTGNTALHYCCLNGNNAAANLLLEVRKYGWFAEILKY